MLQAAEQRNSLRLANAVALVADASDQPITEYVAENGGAAPRTSSTLTLAERAIRNMEIRALCEDKNYQRVKLTSCRGSVDLKLFTCMTSLRDIHVEMDGDICNIPSLQDLPDIRRIYLSSKTMNDSDVRPLCNIETLEEINICNSPNVVNLGNVGRLPRVHTLMVNRTGVIDEFLCGLTLSNTLRRIDLSECLRLTDVEPLASIETLEEIDVSGCFPCVCGIGALGALPRLKILNASLTGITDECLARLSASQSLKKLLLSKCERLTNVSRLDTVTTLQELDLAECKNVVSGIGSLGTLPVLQCLDLSGTGVADDDLCALSCSATISKLIMKRCVLLTNVSPLEKLRTLQHVNIGECINVIEGLNSFSELPSLRTLYMHYTPVTNECLSVISTSQSIVSLNIAACTRITDISCLANLKTLEDVNINMCESVEKGLGDISGLSNLRMLSARSTVLDDECVKIMSSSSNLERSSLEGCAKITDVTPLAAVKSLEYVNLDNCPVVKGIAELGKLPLLRVISLRETNICEEDIKNLKKFNRRLYIER
ncbi:leucine-rich repeat protein (LRRP), putative [Trypanosoma brucei brucei TREU927]|uniref:Leucine-rich repeat protein (LRRP), putative n=1 Tax=Trypanosoma brucei brucei (strain 927/4 GUTat10.1) TaxID=185431 RepID=Q57V18_TRYB2|nr:leucine-rich repeat protein (LRRP), putative [Trypanosoma brucei brucei TREU927]AAX70551.1 leucine-rich repeat protein (LRRP), putative [Trypanosoma brucei]AAZ12257.1 leucine-rich repeat protein (LRRP), putative [Trypanosoma brucei brucei TREU927]